MMSVFDDMLFNINAILSIGHPLSYSTASAVNDLYEGYIFSLIVAAARDEQGAIEFLDVDNVMTKNLVFRTSPGNIYSKAQKYTHRAVDFVGCPRLEIHIGIYVSGKSGVLHECDVAVVDHNEANVCRQENVHPRNAKIALAVECKYHSSTLQLGQARGYLGLLEELTKKQRFLVTNTSSDTSERMINYHGAEREFKVDLKNPRIPRNLQSSFARVFRNYKTKHSI